VELFNETTFPSFLARAQLVYEDLLQAVVVMKATYETLPTGETRLCDTQVPLHLEDESTDFGTLETEIVPAKAWCDLAVLGHARSRSPKRPIKRMQVSLRIGKFTRSVLVTGDRVWQRVLGRLRASEPRPFTELPLTYARAYGGTARHRENVEAGYFANPHGRGYVIRRDDVVRQAPAQRRGDRSAGAQLAGSPAAGRHGATGAQLGAARTTGDHGRSREAADSRRPGGVLLVAPAHVLAVLPARRGRRARRRVPRRGLALSPAELSLRDPDRSRRRALSPAAHPRYDLPAR
jgi:hypothetical protein